MNGLHGASLVAEVSDDHRRLVAQVDAALDALFGADAAEAPDCSGAHAWKLRDLVSLQMRLKLVLMACAPAAQKELGRLVAGGKTLPRAQLARAYRRGVAQVLAQEPTRGRHVNALEHAAGYFRDKADSDERTVLRDHIERYGRGELPLRSARDVLAAAAARHGLTYIQQQMYFA